MPAFLTLRTKKAEFQDLLAETGPAVSLLRTPTPNARILHTSHNIKKARIGGPPVATETVRAILDPEGSGRILFGGLDPA